MDSEKIGEFVEWALALMPPKYDLDCRRRFTPQVPGTDGVFCWIETHNFDRDNPKFYSTEGLIKKWEHETTLNLKHETI